MARSRNIKPGFFTNADLLDCQPLARLLFAGLWCEADRRGILEDRPKTLKIKLLPGDNCDVEELLEELSVHGFIQRYEVDGVRCIYLPGFSKHQNPHMKETPNTLPAPDGFDASTVQAPVKHHASPADSLNLIPDSLNPIPPKSPKGDRGSAESEKSAPKPRTRKSPDYTPEFLAFWKAYIAHDRDGRSEKPDTARVWATLTDDERSDAVTAIPLFASGSDWQRGFVPGAQVWLRARKWENPPKIGPASGAVDWNDPVQVEAYRRHAEREMLSRL